MTDTPEPTPPVVPAEPSPVVPSPASPETPAPVPAPPPLKRKFRFPRILSPKVRTFLSPFVIIVIVIILVGFVAINMYNLLLPKEVSPTPTPSPAPTATPIPYQPSPYADDEEVLAIETQLEALESQLEIINFRLDTLHLPTLDWDVSF